MPRVGKEARDEICTEQVRAYILYKEPHEIQPPSKYKVRNRRESPFPGREGSRGMAGYKAQMDGIRKEAS